MCAAYDALPAERRHALDPLVVHHSYQHFMETREHGRLTLSDALKARKPRRVPSADPRASANGRRALWASTGTVKGIAGMPAEEALQLIDDLVAFITQDRFVYQHKWQAGDVLVWDNPLHPGTPARCMTTRNTIG